MELTVDARALASAVAWADKFAPSRPVAPICAALHLTATADGTLTLTATDYDTTARATADARVDTPGQAAVSSRTLAAATARLGDGPATLRLDGPRLHISCGTTSYTLITMAAEDYPTAPDAPEAIGEVDAADLAATLTQVATTTGAVKEIPEFAGIQLHFGQTLTAASSDRYRITVRDTDWEPAPGTHAAAVLAHGAALTAAVRGMAGTITIGADTNLLGLSDETRSVTTTLFDNTRIPNLPVFLGRRFDAGAATTATVDTAALIAAIDSASAVVAAGASGFITLATTDSAISVTGGDDDTGACEVAAHTTGPDVAAMYHPSWLLGILKALRADTVRLHLPDGLKPTLITAVADDGTDSDGYRAMVNPRRHLTAQAAA